MPGERQRMHVGYAPQDGTTSGGYSSGFYLQGRPGIKPESVAKDIPVVFLVAPHSDLPEVALGLQASGKGAIVAEGTFSEEVGSERRRLNSQTGPCTDQTERTGDNCRRQ